MYPAKFSFDSTTASCTDFVVYNTGLAGSGTQANVVAYDNLYSGCSGNGAVPAVYWAYNTGTGSAVTSPVLSGDGTKVAFIESPGSGAATLRILKWLSGEGTDSDSPVAPNSSYTYVNTYAGASTNHAWNTTNCPSTASCMISVAFQTVTSGDTRSSPWYDYASDTIYVGDSGGYLHQFTGVFNGTPGESTNNSNGTCGSNCKWPVLVSSGHQLTGPVYDTSTGLVFVGDTVTTTPFHSVCAVTGINGVCTTVGTLTTSGTISGTNRGMDDAPIVDSNLSKAYVFIGYDNSSSSSCQTTGGSSSYCGVVIQYATKTSIASGSQTPVKAIMGRGGLNPLYVGAFNDGYYSAGTGALYVCGGSPSGTAASRPTLYKIAITTGTMGSSTTGPYIASATGPFCSPVTEVLNGTSDYLFMSVTYDANPMTGCTGGATGGCIYTYTIPTTFNNTLAATAGLTAAGGTSGIIIDNTTGTTTGSQVYFSPLSAPDQGCAGNGTAGSGAGGCAVQASQSALH
jgi:hypothetical protein